MFKFVIKIMIIRVSIQCSSWIKNSEYIIGDLLHRDSNQICKMSNWYIL